MCTGFEPALAEAVVGDAFLGAVAGDAFLPGALAATGGFDAAAAAAFASEFGAYDAGAAGLGSLAGGGAEGAGTVVGDSYLPGALGADGANAAAVAPSFESYMSGLGNFGTPVGEAGASTDGFSTRSLGDAFSSGTPSMPPQDTSMAVDGFSGGDYMGAEGFQANPLAGASDGFSTQDYSGAANFKGQPPSLWDSLKSGYKGVMDYSPFGSGGPTIGNAKDGMSVISGLGSLYDMNAKRQMGRQQMAYNQNAMDKVNNYGAIGSPERDLLKQEIERRDAKAGRNSQYGQREVELNAKLAATRANYGAQTLGTGFNNNTAALNNQYGSLNSLFYNAGRG